MNGQLAGIPHYLLQYLTCCHAKIYCILDSNRQSFCKKWVKSIYLSGASKVYLWCLNSIIFSLVCFCFWNCLGIFILENAIIRHTWGVPEFFWKKTCFLLSSWRCVCVLEVYCLLQQQINTAKRAAAFSEYDSMIGLLQEILSGVENFPC